MKQGQSKAHLDIAWESEELSTLRALAQHEALKTFIDEGLTFWKVLSIISARFDISVTMCRNYMRYERTRRDSMVPEVDEAALPESSHNFLRCLLFFFRCDFCLEPGEVDYRYPEGGGRGDSGETTSGETSGKGFAGEDDH